MITTRFAPGRGAVVTGAAQGLGRAVAERLLAEGVGVLLVDRDGEVLRRTAAELAGRGRLDLLECDVTDASAPEALRDRALRSLGSVDILVNNAGIAGSRPVHELEEERWRQVLEVNLAGTFRVTRAVLPAMMEAGYGRIVGVASMTGVTGFRGSSDYAVSKAGILALTRSLAADYGRYGITANAVAPGAIHTPLAERMLASRPRWYTRANLELKPVERFGRPEDVAAAVAYLASDEAGYVSGHTLVVDGGLTATHFVPDRFSDEAEEMSGEVHGSSGR
jgi:NAD(P)-dependent dehydrogenase (short-subunit alcohol dehydrogenase family)